MPEPGNGMVSAVVVEVGERWVLARTDEGDVRFHRVACPDRLLAGSRVRLWRMRVGSEGREAWRAALDEATRDAHQAELLAFFARSHGGDEGRARRDLEREIERARRARLSRGEEVPELRGSGIVTAYADREGVVALGTTELSFERRACVGFRPQLGQRVQVLVVLRRSDGSLVADELAIDGATQGAVREVARSPSPSDQDERRFLAALLTQPHDEATWDAFQAFLLGRRDPRGELMRIERALEAGPDPALERARAEHFARHGAELLGELAPPTSSVTVRFHRGLIVSAHVAGSEAQAQLDALRALPTAVRIRSLVLESTSTASIAALGRWAPPALEDLRLGVDPDCELAGATWPSLRRCPRLSRLEVIGRSGPKMEGLDAPWPWRLTRLACRSTQLSPGVVEAIFDQDWPALEELWLGLGTSGVSAMTIASLLRSERLPALTSLGLCNTTLTNHIARALPASPMLSRLQRLDLWGGTLTDGGAAAIGAHASRFPHLAQLDARANLLGPLGVSYLVRAVPHALVSDQREGYGSGERAPAIPSTDVAAP